MYNAHMEYVIGRLRAVSESQLHLMGRKHVQKKTEDSRY